MSTNEDKQPPDPIRSELTHEQEMSLVHPAPLTESLSREMKERIEMLEKRSVPCGQAEKQG